MATLDKAVTNNLRQLRKGQGLVLWALVIKSGVSISTIAAVERHGYCPGPDIRYKLAEALDTTVAAIWPSLQEGAGVADV